jgi:alkanesulfonate monooxygenase SsuD/methylene tetrahydromethanopterin reductase-like flavin-dependent oxidoreductase (luciferase family)
VSPETGVRRGLFLPPFDALASPQAMAEIAVTAEAAGWDGVFVWDHLLYSEPVREIADPWICMAAMAVATERIALGPMVTPLARRRPQVVARQAVSLDRLCNGRLILGFGLGDDGGPGETGELTGFGDEGDARRRGEMLTEGLELLGGLLSGEEVGHRGEHYTADGVRFLPSPAQPSGIPIWLAARWPHRAPVRRAARHDGLFTIQLQRPDDLATLREWVSQERTAGGRFDFVAHGAPGDDPAPWAQAGATWFLTQLGPYDLDLSEVRDVAAAGPSHR